MRLECIFCHFPKCFCTCHCVPNSHLSTQHVIARNTGDFCRIPRQSPPHYNPIAANMDMRMDLKPFVKSQNVEIVDLAKYDSCFMVWHRLPDFLSSFKGHRSPANFKTCIGIKACWRSLVSCAIDIGSLHQYEPVFNLIRIYYKKYF
jgi:hypothetical protein